MEKKLSKVAIAPEITQRGTGESIDREKALVYDFMPVMLGERFRVDTVLSKMLLRPAPVDAPFMLMTRAYETLGNQYADKSEWNPALECYRIALDSRTSFVKYISRIQGNALLNQTELDHMDLSTDLERKLMKWAMKTGKLCEPSVYLEWVKGLKTLLEEWRKLNRGNYGSQEYIEACLKIGHYNEALANADRLKDKKWANRIRRNKPKEILDIRFLRKFINDNFPESSF